MLKKKKHEREKKTHPLLATDDWKVASLSQDRELSVPSFENGEWTLHKVRETCALHLFGKGIVAPEY